MKKHTIKEVAPESIAEELGIEPGDLLLTINDREIEDIFDYHYLVNDEYLAVLLEKGNGEEWELEIEKDYDEDLGLVFDNGLMDNYRSCSNKCIFCFIDQLPKGMRDTLYFKDDDSRLSFLQGNYVTLTNMKDEDIERIIEYRLAPINISVHTTDPALRCRMLNNRFAGEALKKIRTLYEAGIEMNGQIVLCRGINDGRELERTIDDLSGYLPHMRSLSVVPVGLTRYREGLFPLEPFDREAAREVLDIIDARQRSCLKDFGTHFVHAGDEWYFLADRPFPESERYDGYLQLENGVGMVRLLLDEFSEALQKHEGDIRTPAEVSICTGTLAAPVLEKLARDFRIRFPSERIHVYPIRNDFFGDTITVSGLLTGGDIIAQLKGRPLGERLLIPVNALRSGERVFLDDITVSDVEEALKVPVVITEPGGEELFRALTRRP